jgi:hypothetical protein
VSDEGSNKRGAIQQRWKSVVAIMIAGCLVVVLAAALGLVAIQRGLVAPPELNVCLADGCIAARTLRIPACPPLVPCGVAPGIVPAQDLYTVWVYDKARQTGGVPNPRTILALPLRR